MSTPAEELALVRRLSQAQRLKLRKNRHRTHWRRWGVTAWYRRRILDEFMELADAIRGGLTPEEVWLEAADIANFAAMVADRYEQEYRP